MKERVRNALLFALTGVLLGIPFTFHVVWPLGFIGAALFIYTLQRMRSGTRTTFFCGYGAGAVLYTIVLLPTFAGVLPLNWFGIPPGLLQYVAAFGSLAVMVGALSVGPGLFAVLARSLLRRDWADVFILPSLWVLTEVIGVLVFNAITWGPGSYFGAHITPGWLGYLLANDASLLLLARLGGIYLLSFFVMGVGVLLVRTYESKGGARRRYLAVIALLLAAYGVGHAVIASDKENEALTITAAVISRYEVPLLTISREEEAARNERLRTILAPLHDVDVLILPENSAFLRTVFFSGEREATLSMLAEMGDDGEFPLVIDTEDLRIANGPIHSRVAYFTSPSSVAYGNKQLLMPLGEYIPYVYRFVINLFGGDALLTRITNARGYEPGPPGGYGIADGVVVTARFCDEAFSPELFRAQANGGAHILTNLSSLSWFHGSTLVYEQMKRVAQVRAAENGRWLLQSGNMAPAFVLDSYGRVIEETEHGQAAALVIDVPQKTEKTPYTLLGSLVLLIPIAIVVFAIVRRKTERNA